MVIHISVDSKIFMKSKIVKQIRLKIDEYAGKAEELRQKVIDCENYTKEEYRKKYFKLFKQITETRNELMNDEIIKKFYTDSYISLHLADMSIIRDEKI